MNKGISRRDLFKFGGVAAVGAAGAAALGDCSPKVAGSSAKEEAASTVLEGYCAPDGGWLGSAPDVKATSTVDCDVLVVGSGHAGIQAALAAAEGGAKVVVVDLVTEENRKVKGEDIGHVNSQWLIDQGYGPYNVGEVTAEFVKRTAGRVNPEIIRKFVANSGEMFDHTAALVQWPDSRIKVTETADPSISPLDPSQCICQVPGIAADGPVEYPVVRGDYKSWAAVAQFMGSIQHEEFPGVAAFSRLDEFQRFAILKAQDLGAEWPKNERRVNAGLVTLAGVTCNENLEVMNASTDEPIGGLWAAGNCLGGRYGTGYATPFAGNSIGMAMIHGRVAGKLATGQAVL